MTTWEAIALRAKALPADKQQEALEFIEFLHERAHRRGPVQSVCGLWQDLNIDLSDGDIEEIRREIWEHFPREDLR